MKTQTLFASIVSGLLVLAPMAKADQPASKTEQSVKKGDNKHCECGDCKKGKCAKKKCEHCHHTDEEAKADEGKKDEKK